MIKTYSIYGGERTVEYNYSEAGNELILKKIIDWLAEHNVSSGECLLKVPVVDAVYLIKDVADNILEIRSVNEDDDY